MNAPEGYSALGEYYKWCEEAKKAEQESNTFKMRRAAAISRQLELFPALKFGPPPSLLEICLVLRSGVNGSAAEWKEVDVKAAVAMLKERLATWIAGSARSKKADDAAKAFIRAIIEEVESYRA